MQSYFSILGTRKNDHNFELYILAEVDRNTAFSFLCIISEVGARKRNPQLKQIVELDYSVYVALF